MAAADHGVLSGGGRRKVTELPQRHVVFPAAFAVGIVFHLLNRVVDEGQPSVAVLKKAAERFVHPRPVIEADAVVTGVDRVVDLDQRVGVGNSSLPERLSGDAARGK